MGEAEIKTIVGDNIIRNICGKSGNLLISEKGVSQTMIKYSNNPTIIYTKKIDSQRRISKISKDNYQTDCTVCLLISHY